jgi:hypothetical protein
LRKWLPASSAQIGVHRQNSASKPVENPWSSDASPFAAILKAMNHQNAGPPQFGEKRQFVMQGQWAGN